MITDYLLPETEEEKIKKEEERKRQERIEKVKLWQATLRQEGLKIMHQHRPSKIEIL